MILCDNCIEELNNLAAFGKIIKSPKQMPKKVSHTPIDKEWKEWIKQKFWATNYEGKIAHNLLPLLELRDFLLGFGGEEVCLPAHESDLENILSRGQLWYGDRVEFMKGEPCECHRNTCYLWLGNKARILIATGYALSDDGMWRQHTWGVYPQKKKIIETTVERVLYFGFVMNLEESENFTFLNTI